MPWTVSRYTQYTKCVMVENATVPRTLGTSPPGLTYHLPGSCRGIVEGSLPKPRPEPRTGHSSCPAAPASCPSQPSQAKPSQSQSQPSTAQVGAGLERDSIVGAWATSSAWWVRQNEVPALPLRFSPLRSGLDFQLQSSMHPEVKASC